MKQIERMNLIESIACDLQDKMVTSQINTFLCGFGVICEKVNIVPSKRVYVESLLAPQSEKIIVKIASELGLYRPNIFSAENFEKCLELHGYQAAHEDFERAMSMVEADPEQALGNASSILESICKSILERLGKDIPKDQSMKPLVKATYGAMNLSPDSHADPDIKQVLGGITNAVVGIGVMRTKYRYHVLTCPTSKAWVTL